MARLAAREFLKSVPPRTEVRLILFSDKEIGSAQGVEASLDLLSKLPTPFGRTPLFDAIVHAANKMGDDGGMIVVITDGGDNRSKADWRKLAPMLWKQNVGVSFLVLARPEPFTPDEESGWYGCQELAKRSAGVFAGLVRSDLPTPTVRELLFRTRIKMTIPREAASKKWKLAMLTSAKSKGVSVLSPDRLPDCQSSHLSPE